MKRGILVIALMGLLTVSAWADLRDIKEGNRFFKKGRYDQALKIYSDALVDQPHSSVLHFNAGGAAYQLGDFARAEKEFTEATQSAIPQLKAAAHYNKGNTYFRQQRWADAIESYKESLRINPADEDAKYNLGVARRTQQNPPQPSKSQGKPGESKNQGAGGDQKQDNDGGEKKEAAAQAKKNEMSREDAERLLSAAGAGEMKKSNQRYPKGDVPQPDEDW